LIDQLIGKEGEAVGADYTSINQPMSPGELPECVLITRRGKRLRVAVDCTDIGVETAGEVIGSRILNCSARHGEFLF